MSTIDQVKEAIDFVSPVFVPSLGGKYIDSSGVVGVLAESSFEQLLKAIRPRHVKR